MSTKKMQIIGLKGKSAYQYAQDGGYTGTEAEFKEKMANELDAVYDYEDLNEAILATAIKPEVNGEFIHITDSAALPIMYFGMEGKTEQKSTEGTNYLDLSSMPWFEWDEENNGYKVISQAPDMTTGQEKYFEAGYYVFSVTLQKSDNTYSSVQIKMYNSEDELAMAYTIGAGNEGVLKTYGFQIPESGTYTIVVVGYENSKAYIGTILQEAQIRPGTTVLPYEPYTGAQPSPNPNYPQEITNAGTYNEATGRYEIGCRVGNKNLFNKNNVNILDGCYFNGGVISYLRGYQYKIIWIPCKPNTDYTVSRQSIVGTPFQMGFSNSVEVGAAITNNKSSTGLSITSNSGDNKYLLVYLMHQSDYEKGITLEQIYEGLQIEIGVTPTTFVDYTKTDFTLTSPVPLTKWDKLVKRDGVYGWSINYLDEIFDGSDDEEWFPYTYNTHGISVFNIITPKKLAGVANLICSSFIICNGNVWVSKYINQCSGHPIDAKIYFNTSLEVGDIEGWRVLLNENPIKVQYQTTEEQSFHPLPDNEQALLRSLETYYQVTNIFNDQNCPMSIQYIADTQTYIDNLTMSLTNAVVSLGGEV